MKVTLINREAPDGRQFSNLTIGSEYEVLGIECELYRLADDGGEPILFDPGCFRITNSDEPKFWISRFEEGKRYAYPPGWGVPGFFEAWHDKAQLIRKVFAEQLQHWYPDVKLSKN